MGGEPIGGSIDWPVIGQQVGLGMLLGFAVGYLAKKALKVALVVAGILFLILVGLQHYDFIAINWTRIEETYSQALNPPGGLDAVIRGWVDSLAAVIPGAGGFAVGFFWGMRKG
ncbi:MAG: FUN14 domain-containing protein [Clostridia bacterium]